MHKKFDEAIWSVVSQIPRGQVMGYGEVARAAGFPRRARMVSKAMSRSPQPLPWHRVVKSDRTLAFDPQGEMYKKQAQLLQGEGVKFVDGKVIPLRSDKNRELDEILWGPRN